MAEQRPSSTDFVKFLSKFTKRELDSLIKPWGKIGHSVNTSQPKRVCVRQIAKRCKVLGEPKGANFRLGIDGVRLALFSRN